MTSRLQQPEQLGPRLTARAAVKAARSLADAAIETVWSLGFAGAGRWGARRAVAPWRGVDGRPVLVVAPHPDDEVIGCGGALLLHARAGDPVTIAYVTDGRRSRALGLTPDEMARRRRDEAYAAAQRLGAGRVDWLGLREGEWSDDEGVAALGRVLAERAPALVYGPSCIDFHPEHQRVAHALAVALAESAAAAAAGAPPSPSPSPAEVRVYQVQAPLTSVLVNMAADTSPVAAEVNVAAAEYVTQSANLGRARRQRRYAAAYHHYVHHYAEELWRMSAAAYVALHTAPAGAAPCKIFRGLRASPLSDPLCYLVGRAARHQAARAAAG